MFELEQSINQWRERMTRSKSFSTEQVTEMEGHLRDSTTDLAAGTLSKEEAFLIASRRLGSPTELKTEFRKDNLKTIWTNRVMWILIGMFFARIVLKVFFAAGEAMDASMLYFLENARLAALANVGTKVLLIGFVIYELWHFLAEKGQKRLRALDRGFKWAFSNPRGTFVALLPHITTMQLVNLSLLEGYHLACVPLKMITVPLAKAAGMLALAYWLFLRQPKNGALA